MATKILAKRSAVQNKVPLTTDLSLGEFAINTYDGILYFKKSPSGVDSIVTTVTLDATQTLTNKLLLPVVSTTSSATTLSWNSSTNNVIEVTALAGNLLISADSGSPVNGQKVLFRITSTGSYTLSLSTVTKGFSVTAVTVPSSLTATTYHMGCIYNSNISKWEVVAFKGVLSTYTPTTGTSSQLLANNGSGGYSNVTVGSGLSYSGGTLTATSGSGTVTTSGSPTTNYLSKFTGSTIIGNSVIYDDGTNVGIGTATLTKKLTVSGDISVNDIIVGRGTGNSSTSTMLGYQAGNTNGGAYSTGIGYQALTAVTSSSTVNNTAIGYQASKAITTGSRNTSVGAYALWSNTTGVDNIGIGYFAGYGYTTGSSNTAIGNESLLTVSTNSNNTAVGYQSLKFATGNYNTAVGSGAAYSTTTGNVTAVGYRALYTVSGGTYNVALGAYSLYSTIGNYNTAVGYESLRYSNPSIGTGYNTAVGTYALTGISGQTNSGIENTSVGYNGAANNTSGNYNTSIGSQSLTNNQIGEWNTALGRGSLFNSSGSYNTAVGGQSLVSLTSGNYNIAIGINSAAYMTSGTANTLIGSEVYYINGNDYYNSAELTRTVAVGTQAIAAGWGPVDAVAIGYQAGYSNAGYNNIAIGSYSAAASSYDYYWTTSSSWYDSASDNIAIGTNSLYYNSSGDGNIAIGTDALKGSSTGIKYNNVAIGYKALQLAGTGASSNTAVGFEALKYSTTGSNNTSIGRNTLTNVTSGSTNVAVGASSGYSFTTGENNVIIGYMSGYYIPSNSSRNILIGPQTYSNILSVSNNNTVLGGWTGTGGGISLTGYNNNVVIADGQGNVKFAYDGSIHELKLLTNGSNRLSIDSSGVVTIAGDLVVNGTTTTINSTILTVDDINIELGSVSTPTDTTAAGGGITLKGTTDKTISWDSSNGWSSSETFNLVSGKTYKINGTDVLSATTLGSGITTSSLTSVGTITSGTWSGSFGSVSGANLTSLSAGNLTGTISSTVLNNSSVVTLTDSQTLTNKTLTSPTINNGSINGTSIGDTTQSTGKFTTLTSTGQIISTLSNADEGGELVLAKPVTNTSIDTSVTVDIWQNRIRFFETGGSNRGAYIDFSSLPAGVTTNLLASGPSIGQVITTSMGYNLF